jgi:hypothetical protein
VFWLPKEDRDNADVVIRPNLGGVETCIEDIFANNKSQLEGCDDLFAAFVMLNYAFRSVVLQIYLKNMIKRFEDVYGLERDTNRARHTLAFFENRTQYKVVKKFMKSIMEKDTKTASHMAYSLDLPYEQPHPIDIIHKLEIAKTIARKTIERKYTPEDDDDDLDV